MKIERIFTGCFKTNCYIVHDNDNLIVIDPGADFQSIMDHITSEVTHIFLTHAHFDHIGALNQMHEVFPKAKIYIGENEPTDPRTILDIAMKAGGLFFDNNPTVPECAEKVRDNDVIGSFTVLSTPGHTSGSICFYNEKNKILFSGDTLFYHGYGRTDLGGNDEDMENSLKKLMALDKTVLVYPGHGFSTTIDEESAFIL